jgi:protein TonB
MNTNFEITGNILMIGLGVGLMVLLAIILLARLYFKRVSNEELRGSSGPAYRVGNKYPKADVFKYSPMIWRLSLIAVLMFIIAAFNWTIYEKEVFIPDDALTMDVDIEVEVPRSTEPPPPPPPPPPPTIEAVAEVDILEEDDIEFVDQSVDADTYIEAPVYEAKSTNDAPPPPPPPPPPPEPEAEEIFKVVEEMPRFPGCEDISVSLDEKKMCSQKKLLEFIYENIRYPAVARDNGIQGTVVVSFVVNTDGKIADAKVVRDIGGGCGGEALRIVEMMNDLPERWVPGRQRGRAVRVMFNLPVKFKLELR